MGKRLVIIGFLLCMGVAFYVYLMHERTSLRQGLDRNKVEPRIVMEEFTVYRYAGAELQSQLSARLGQFFEPNLVELDGEIRGERYREIEDPSQDRTETGVETETFGAETATIYFDAKSLSKMLERSQLVKAEMNGFIEVGVKDHLLTTDYAVYQAASNTLKSNRPVRVDGENRVFTSEDGFIYQIANETLSMIGLVKGVFKPDE